MVPDSNILKGATYSCSRGALCKEENVVLSRSALLEDQVVIGSGSHIGANSRIARSVIGRNCRIGNNVVIEGAFLWDGVVVKDGSFICRSILANNVVVDENVIIEKGCILSFDVRYFIFFYLLN